jgi:hypothetical protein
MEFQRSGMETRLFLITGVWAGEAVITFEVKAVCRGKALQPRGRESQFHSPRKHTQPSAGRC